MCPAWLLVAVVMVGGVRAAVSECWDHPSCQSSSSIMECIQLCCSDLSAETPVIPGPAHLQLIDPASSLTDTAPSEPDPAPSIPDSAPPSKRSYSMEHFRWGKPVGRKRRPVKVYTSNDVEEESAEVFPGEIKRAVANQLLPLDPDEANQEVLLLENEAQEEEAQNGRRAELLGGLQQKKNSGGGYKMKHFRWSGPPESKRYGGFMKSWDERGQRPLLTLFKNVINKDQQQV